MSVSDLAFGARAIWAANQLVDHSGRDKLSWRQQLEECYENGDLLAGRQVVLGVDPAELAGVVVNPVLHQVVRAGDLKTFELALSRGCYPNGMDCHGRTPGHWAAELGHLKILQVWQAAGGDLRSTDHQGHSILRCGCRSGQAAIVNWLLGHKALITEASRGGAGLLHEAIIAGSPAEIVRLLCEIGVDVNEVAAGGNTSLHLAVARGLPSTVLTLLRYHSDPCATNERGETADIVTAMHDPGESYRLACALVGRQRWSLSLIKGGGEPPRSS